MNPRDLDLAWFAEWPLAGAIGMPGPLVVAFSLLALGTLCFEVAFRSEKKRARQFVHCTLTTLIGLPLLAATAALDVTLVEMHGVAHPFSRAYWAWSARLGAIVSMLLILGVVLWLVHRGVKAEGAQGFPRVMHRLATSGMVLLLGIALIRSARYPAPANYVSNLPLVVSYTPLSDLVDQSFAVGKFKIQLRCKAGFCALTNTGGHDRTDESESLGSRGLEYPNTPWKGCDFPVGHSIAVRAHGVNEILFLARTDLGDETVCAAVRTEATPYAWTGGMPHPLVHIEEVSDSASPPRAWIVMAATSLLIGAAYTTRSKRFRKEGKDDQADALLTHAGLVIMIGGSPILAALLKGLVITNPLFLSWH